MKVDGISCGELIIDGKLYTEDIVIRKGRIEPRKKSVSRMMKARYGHTPLTIHENIQWDCETLIVGSGLYGSLPVTDEVFKKAEELGVKLVVEKTKDALKHINEPDTNFVIHVTC